MPVAEAEPLHVFVQQFDVLTGLYWLIVEEGAVGECQVKDVGLDDLAVIP